MPASADVSVYLAGLAGLASFLSPCVLPLVPPYLAFLGRQAVAPEPAGAGGEDARAEGTLLVATAAPTRTRLLAAGGAFVAGVSVVFILFFYALRTVLAPVQGSPWFTYVAGAVVIVLALQVAQVVNIPLLMRTAKVAHTAPKRGGVLGGFLLGLAFAAGWTPCIGATLGAVLSSAISDGTTAHGLLLVSVYCIGLGVPFLLLAGGLASARPLVAALNRHRRVIDLASSAVLLLMGLLLLTDNLTLLTTWLSDVMPEWLQGAVTL